MSSPDKPKPRWRDRLRETRQARKGKATERARSKNAARQAMHGRTRPPAGGTGSGGI
jgi:hypothetical protein